MNRPPVTQEDIDTLGAMISIQGVLIALTETLDVSKQGAVQPKLSELSDKLNDMLKRMAERVKAL